MTRARSMGAASAVLCFIVVWGLTTHGKYSASGDEPHYLIVARSLVIDHDLDVSNNYAANEGRFVGQDGLEPGPHARRAADGRLLSVHDPGLPVILVPVYGVAAVIAAIAPAATLARFRMTPGLFAYSIVSLAIVAATMASVAVLIRGLGRVVEPRIAAAVGILVALSPPVLTHSFLVFPEAIAFAVCCVVVWWTLTPAPPTFATFALAASLGCLPWFHRKFSLLAIGLASSMLLMHPRIFRRWSPTARIVALMLLIVPHALFYVWTFSTWGTFVGPLVTGSLPLAIGDIPRGLAGLWIDRQYGLVSYSPIYLMLPACFFAAWADISWTAVPVASVVVPAAAFVEWWAGFAPAARYLVPIVPFCAAAVALATRFRAIRWSLTALTIAQAVIVAYGWQHPRTLWPTGDLNPLLEHLGAVGRWYDAALPSVRHGEYLHALIVPVLIFVANAALAIVVERERSRNALASAPKQV